MKSPEEIAADLAARMFSTGPDRGHGADIIADAIRAERVAADARITELLEANTRYQQEARDAREQRDAVMMGFKGMARAIAAMEGLNNG